MLSTSIEAYVSQFERYNFTYENGVYASGKEASTEMSPAP